MPSLSVQLAEPEETSHSGDVGPCKKLLDKTLTHHLEMTTGFVRLQQSIRPTPGLPLRGQLNLRFMEELYESDFNDVYVKTQDGEEAQQSLELPA